MSQELCTSKDRAPQRALLKALGLTDAELEKPIVAVVSAQSELSPGCAGLDRVTDAVKHGIYAGGCTPVVIPAFTMFGALATGNKGLRYALPAREIIADSVETTLCAHAFDGAVFVGGGEDAVPGMLMGALRANLPAVFVSGGPMPCGSYNGADADINSVYAGIAKVNDGSMNIEELDALTEAACPALGGYAADDTDCLVEALGLALPGNGSAVAGSAERIRIAKRSGAAVCELISEAVTPRMIITKRTITNALTLDIALGAPGSSVLHLMAIAAEAGVAAGLDLVQTISDKTPVLVAEFGANAQRFHAAGGVMAVLHELADRNLIDGSAHTVTGRSLAEEYDYAASRDTSVIAVASEPVHPAGTFAAVYGTLAEEGGIARRVGTKAGQVFSGKARCFNGEEDAVAAVVDGRIKSGDVVVIRYEGPVGGPGMRSLQAFSAAVIAAGLDGKIALVTDGRAGRRLNCVAVYNVCPEAAADGKIALVADGDAVKLDIPSGRVNLDVPAKTLDARRKKLRPRDPNAEGWLLRYQNLVTSASKGAVLKKKF